MIRNAKKWKKNNPIKRCESNRRYRARKLNNFVEKYTEKEVIELYGINCHICSKEIDFNAPRNCKNERWEYGLHIDHLIPLSLGGFDSLANVRPAHALCNIKKGAKINFVSN
jgi:5-methylcytosine-specific restriction endonuclease McrA